MSPNRERTKKMLAVQDLRPKAASVGAGYCQTNSGLSFKDKPYAEMSGMKDNISSGNAYFNGRIGFLYIVSYSDDL